MSRCGSVRRDLLRIGGLAAALASQSGVSARPAASPYAYICNVRDYGAVGDGKALDTGAVNRAIEACASSGGGTVIVPAGNYLCFSIHLKSCVHLLLSAGTAIIAADSPRPGQSAGYQNGRYDDAEPNGGFEAYQDFGHNHWHNSLMWGEDLHDISISGPGLIWGRGLSRGGASVMLQDPFQADQNGVGNKTIALKNCRNVRFQGFSILKAGHFGLLLTGVDNLVIDGLLIDTDRDGMDIDSCRNVRVTDCAVNSPWDDGICPKSSLALGYARATENLTISDCYLSGCWELGSLLDASFRRLPDVAAPHTGRIKLGTESNGGFKNITIANCVFEGCQGFALESVDGALLEDIAITNITMRDIVSCPLFMRLGARLRGPQVSTQTGALRRILVSNLTVNNCASKFGSIIGGVPGYAIEDLKFSNIFVGHQGGASAQSAKIDVPEDVEKYPEPNMFGVLPAHGFFIRHASNLEMSHVEIRPAQPDARPAFYLQDVTRADFFAITAPPAPAFALRRVKDIRLAWCRAAGDTHLDFAEEKSL